MSNHGPVMAWHPETGESQVYPSEADVPEGHLPHHPNDANKPVPVSVKGVADQTQMSREEIVAALSAGGVTFNPRAKHKELAAVLREAVTKALFESGVDPVPDFPTKQLMELLPPAE
jgi:hypothetical protein